MMFKSYYPALVILLFLALGCSSNSKIIGSWKSPEKSDSAYKDIFIYAMINDDFFLKKTIEEDLGLLLEKKGLNTGNALSEAISGNNPEEKKADLVKKIRENGHDAILTVAIIDQTNETRYVPGINYYNPVMYGGYVRFGGYYSMYSPMMYTPGYYSTEKNYYAEVNLYDTHTENLVWSAQSKTTNPTNFEKDIYEFSKVVINQLVKDGLILTQK